MESWYLLRCKTQQSDRAQWHLENQGFQIFAPTHRAEKKRRGKRTTVVEPLFPGYIFIHLDLHHDNHAKLRSTRGLLGLVRFGGYPTRVPDSVIESIQHRSEAMCQEQPAPLYSKGMPVEVKSGPFAGLPAVFDEMDGEGRCFILLDMMGKQQRLTFEESDIDKVS